MTRLAGTSNELDVQNEWEETYTHTHSQGPASVQAHGTGGITGSEGQEGANGVGGGIQPFLSLVDREVEFCVLTI